MFHILVVDDSRSVHSFIKACLVHPEITLTSVSDGKEAIELLSKNSTAFELILLDWNMPVLDGPHTLDLIVKQSPNTPVIMMTTKSAIQDIAQMLAKGAKEYMFKPFTSEVLFDKIELATGRSFPRAT